MYSRDKPLRRSLECYFGICFPRCFATQEINTQITLWWVLKWFVTWVHTLFSICQWQVVLQWDITLSVYFICIIFIVCQFHKGEKYICLQIKNFLYKILCMIHITAFKQGKEVSIHRFLWYWLIVFSQEWCLQCDIWCQHGKWPWWPSLDCYHGSLSVSEITATVWILAPTDLIYLYTGVQSSNELRRPVAPFTNMD